ncbi:MAG TPA: hypothetical protein ENN81_13150 [Phycisphaerales bacterium]|nr:hypothetical protein [Phycisphaerales bacterium]
MSLLRPEQQELLFDFCMGLTSPEQSAQAEALIKTNPRAAQLHTTFTNILSPLNTIEPRVCPDELVEGTIWRLKHANADGHRKLDELLTGEQSRRATVRVGFWQDMGRRLATAAVFVIVGSLMITTFRVISGYARQNAHRQMCAANLNNIFQGLNQYTSDHDGRMPAVMASSSTPWWKLGYQGPENQSNARPLWMMVKMNYIKPESFVCPGGRSAEYQKIDPSLIQDYYDFPSRAYINYSFQIQCSQGGDGRIRCSKILMADVNPLFETLPADYSRPLRIKLDENLLKVNSINHRRRGQNLLYGDGHVEFSKTRLVGLDDIYTLRDREIYEGCERPASTDDAFCAP